MVENEDKTVSFYHKQTRLFLTVHYMSIQPGGRDFGQIYLNTPIIDARQKFILEPCTGGYRIKAAINGKYLASCRLPNDKGLDQAMYCACFEQDVAKIFIIKKM